MDESRDGCWMELVVIAGAIAIGFANMDSKAPLNIVVVNALAGWIVGLCGLLIQERRIAAFWKWWEMKRDSESYAQLADHWRKRAQVAEAALRLSSIGGK